MGAYTVYTAHQATIPPPPPLPILRPLRRYSFSQCFIDPERCFVCINKLENLPRTDKQTHRQTENSITEATLIPCGSSGGAGQYEQGVFKEISLRKHTTPPIVEENFQVSTVLVQYFLFGTNFGIMAGINAMTNTCQ